MSEIDGLSEKVLPRVIPPEAKCFYLTTTLPYVNAKPHLGFAWEVITADVIARYRRQLGEVVYFNTGTDEHGQKIYQQALARGLEPQTYVDGMVRAFLELKTDLELSYTHFIRTTDTRHVAAAQEFWRRCAASGDIYKKKYAVKYCVGCELEKTDSELDHGFYPLHPDKPLKVREEDNYFFRFSRYQQPLLDFYRQHPDFVRGTGKMKEIVSFVERGLQDFSISRVREKMPWGIPVPGDESQVMYVWFDALVNYISTLGWPQLEGTNFERFWPGVQICGKDNLRQQAAMWQAMLMSAGLPNSRQILVNGFITVDGQKMSKSVGNVIDPLDLVDQYGTENTRFLIAALPVLGGDVDITKKRLHDYYTAYLTNGLGNLASRLAKLASMVEAGWELTPAKSFSPGVRAAMADYHTSDAVQAILDEAAAIDTKLSESKPWLMEDGIDRQRVLTPILNDFLQIVFDLRLLMPRTSQTLAGHFHPRRIMPLPPIFPRLKADQKIPHEQNF